MRVLFFNRALRILLWTNALILMAGAMFGPIYAIFVEKIGGDLMDASFAWSAFALAAGITTFISGHFSDKMKENELLVVAGYVIMGIGFAGYMLVDSIIMLLIVEAVLGVGEAVYSPPFDAVYSKHLDGHRSGSHWGAWESMYYFVMTAGAIAGGYVANHFGFNMLFTIMALLCFSSALYIYKLPRRVL